MANGTGTNYPSAFHIFEEGQKVLAANREGIVKFEGTTEFQEGIWIGVELHAGGGKNDGSVKGVRYFDSKPEHGIFLRPELVKPMPERGANGRAPAAQASPRRRSSQQSAGAAAGAAGAEASPSPEGADSPKARSSLRRISRKDSTSSNGMPAAAAVAPSAPTAVPGAPAAAAAPVAATKAEVQPALAKQIQELRVQIASLNQEKLKADGNIDKEKRRLSALEEQRQKNQVILDQNEDMQELMLTETRLQRAQSAMEKVRRGIASRRQEIQVLGKIRAQLESTKASQGEQELQNTLQVEKLASLLAQSKLEEAQVELMDLEWKIESQADARANNLLGESGLPDKAVEYQEALRALHAASAKEIDEMQRRVQELDKSCSGVHALKRDAEDLTRESVSLEEEIALLEMRGEELGKLLQSHGQLQAAEDDVENELEVWLEARNERLEQLENLIEQIQTERKDAERAISANSKSEEELRNEVCQLAPGVATSNLDDTGVMCARHGHAAAAAVQRPLTEVDADVAVTCVSAYRQFIPASWAPDGTSETGGWASIRQVSSRSSLVSKVEHCFWRADALGIHACTGQLASLPAGSAEADGQYRLSLAACRCAASAVNVLEALHTAKFDASADLQAFESECMSNDQQLSKIIQAVCQTCKLEPATASALSEVEQRFSALRQKFAEVGHEIGLSYLAAAIVTRRWEAAYRYATVVEHKLAEAGSAAGQGAEATASQEAAPVDEKPREEELDAAAGPQTHKEEWRWLSDQLGKLSVQFRDWGKALLNRGAFGDDGHCSDLLPSYFYEHLDEFEALEPAAVAGAAPEILQHATAKIVAGLFAVEQRARLHVQVALRQASPTSLPGWAGCCFSVQQDMEVIFNSKDQTCDVSEKVREQQRLVEAAQTQLAKSADRRAALQTGLRSVLERAERARTLKLEAEKLRNEVHPTAIDQASLGRQLDATRGRFEEQERLCTEALRVMDSLQDTLTAKKGRPQELDGRATLHELVTLQNTRVKNADELLALQLEGIKTLAPLPPDSHQDPRLWSGVNKYADIKRDLLKEWTSIRVPLLTSDPRMRPRDSEMSVSLPHPSLKRIQHLRFNIVSLQGSFSPLLTAPLAGESLAPGTDKASVQAARAAVDLKLEVACPRWAGSLGSSTKFAVLFGELCGLHNVVV